MLVDEGATSSAGGVIFNSREAAGTTYTWAYVNGAVWANNSLYTDRDTNHSTKYGGGLSEGFTSTYFDYAHGLDGPALLNDTHSRDFLFVHPQDGANGYFIMRDGVTTAADGYAYTDLHPNTKSSTGITTVTSDTEYEATINGYLLNKTDVKLNVFYATPPISVTLKNGAITGFANSFEGKYLEAKYQADTTGNARFLTLLFPSDSTHAKANMTRMTGSGYTGASVNHGNGIIDYVFTTSNSSSKSYNGVSYWGYIAAYRKNGTATSFYFIRSGKSFSDGAGYGFSSPSNVSIHMRGKTGEIETASNVNVTFNYPGITGVNLDGVSATIVGSGSGYVTVIVPAGTKSVQLLP